MMTAVFSCCCSRSRVVPANPDGPFRSLEEEKKINSLLSTSHEWNDGAKDHLSLSSTSLPDVGIHEPELHVKGSLHFHIGADFPSSTPKLLAYLAKHEPFHLNWRGISFVDIVEAGTDRKQKLSLRCRSGSLSAFQGGDHDDKGPHPAAADGRNGRRRFVFADRRGQKPRNPRERADDALRSR